jgi:hypothetical protein
MTNMWTKSVKNFYLCTSRANKHEYCAITSERMLHSAWRTKPLTTNGLLKCVCAWYIDMHRTKLGTGKTTFSFLKRTYIGFMCSKEKLPYQILDIC